MISGLLLVSAVMLFWGVRDVWMERQIHNRNDASNAEERSREKEIGVVSMETADIIASGGAADVSHDNKKMWVGIFGIFSYGVAVNYLGFPLATIGIIAYWLLICGDRGPLRIVLTCLIGTGSILVVFVKIGYLALPKGVGPFHDLTVWLFHTLHLF